MGLQAPGLKPVFLRVILFAGLKPGASTGTLNVKPLLAARGRLAMQLAHHALEFADQRIH